MIHDAIIPDVEPILSNSFYYLDPEKRSGRASLSSLFWKEA